jgi:hypothetical protein
MPTWKSWNSVAVDIYVESDMAFSTQSPVDARTIQLRILAHWLCGILMTLHAYQLLS